MHPELVTKLGVALIFFLHGLLLPLDTLKAGMKTWRLHMLVQVSTFLFMPLVGLTLLAIMGHSISDDLRLGFFFLCVLPSTVSSSVAMTASAHGNVAAAVFNATLSSLLGIFITPLWIGLYADTGAALPLGKVIIDLVVWLLLPLIAGQVLRPFLGALAARHKKIINKIDRTTILLLVYTSFCDSMKWNVWTSHSIGFVLLGVGGAFVLFVIVLLTTNLACRILELNQPDRIAAVFCGSKKSLAQGVPMARLMFAGNPAIGVILLPIMIYHPMQLFLCGILAGRWAKHAHETP